MRKAIASRASPLLNLAGARQAGSWAIRDGSMDWGLETQVAMPNEAPSLAAAPLRDDYELLMAVPKRKVRAPFPGPR